MTTKKCTKCLETKPLSSYGVHDKYYSKNGIVSPYLHSICKSCNNKTTMERHRRILDECVSDWSCQICGYDKCRAALEFHHLDETTKKFTIASAVTASEKRLKDEVAKCIILCSNCHRELHAGLVSLNKGK